MRKAAILLLAAVAALAVEPIVNFPMNEGDLKEIKDVAGNVKNIKIDNVSQFSWVGGPDGKALSFNTPDGMKTYACFRFDMPKELDMTKAFTITALVKTPRELHRSRQYVCFYYGDNAGKGPGLRLYISWKMLMLAIGNGTKAEAITSNTREGPILSDTWYRIAATYDGKTAKIYINGVERGRKEIAFPTLPKRKWAMVGATSTSGAAYGFNGVISQLRIYPAVLSANELAAMQQE